MYTIDFETEGIQPYPNFPPVPVGVALKHNDGPSYYLCWGHPTMNNCSRIYVERVLKSIWESGEALLFHNAPFDVAVALKAFGLPEPEPLRVHDTQFLVFLAEPSAPSLGLKPSAERLLGLPPTEQSEVRDWLVANGVVPASMTKGWGAFICKAPGDVVGKYARGDVDRTWELFQFLKEPHSGEPYDRERLLAPILRRAEVQGMPLDLPKLKRDLTTYSLAFEEANRRVVRILGDINIDSGVQLAKAMKAAGLTVPDDQWPKTETGKLSTKREVLEKVVTDDNLYNLLAYRGALKTILGTFMVSWASKAEGSNPAVLHPSWHQVRSPTGGTRTGRLSCSEPNLQNVPTEFDDIVVPEGLPPLPFLRQYLIPFPGEVLLSGDFHSQEIRMLGHFAEGAIQQIYMENPRADIHQVAADLISSVTGMQIKRKQTKIIAYSILYGAGLDTLAERLGITRWEAQTLKSAYLDILVGVREFMRDLMVRAATGEGVVTWGGRTLHAPSGRDYALINYLIQGSSADQTKGAVIEYDRTRVHSRFLATVHDEIVVSVPPQHLASEALVLTKAMESGKFDIPMRATLKVGPNWHEVQPYELEAT